MKLMTRFLHNYFHPLSGKLIFWNILLLILIKLVLPQSAFQFATLIGSMPTFDSREVIRLTNEARSESRLVPLRINAQLDTAAEAKLNNMATEEYFAHVSPSGVTPWFWIQKAQYKYKVAGENLALGFTTSQDTVKAWLDSASHKANILNSEYQDIGVAVKGVKIGETTGVLVVQMFGKPSVQIASVNPSPAPVITPQISPVPSPVLVNGQTKGETVAEPELITAEIAVQHVSTDAEIPAVTEPSQIQFRDAENIRKWTGIMNNTFAVYSLLSAILAIVAFFVFERSRHMAIKMSLHTAIFALAVLMPVTGASLKALIF